MARVSVAQGTWCVLFLLVRGWPLKSSSHVVTAYILAQVLGGVFGAAVVYGNYVGAIDIFEGGHAVRTRATAGLFATFAVSVSDYTSLQAFRTDREM